MNPTKDLGRLYRDSKGANPFADLGNLVRAYLETDEASRCTVEASSKNLTQTNAYILKAVYNDDKNPEVANEADESEDRWITDEELKEIKFGDDESPEAEPIGPIDVAEASRIARNCGSKDMWEFVLAYKGGSSGYDGHVYLKVKVADDEAKKRIETSFKRYTRSKNARCSFADDAKDMEPILGVIASDYGLCKLELKVERSEKCPKYIQTHGEEVTRNFVSYKFFLTIVYEIKE